MQRRTKIGLAVAGIVVLIAMVVIALAPGSEKKIEQKLSARYAIADPQFRRSASVLLGPPFIDGNQVETLLNGDAIFASMLEAIRSARHTITFETYIYWSDSIGTEFAQALSERAQAGVKVHVMLDWVGSMKMEADNLEQMRRAGVQVERFHEPSWWQLTRLNNRTHRKVLVVDGRVGFTGGVGIADKWRGRAQDPEHWRDTHYRVEGPVVAQMQAVFNDNWIKATGRVLDGEAYFPALPTRGAQPAQMFSSSPSGGSASMHLMYLMSISSARRSIHLSSSYFVPDDLTISTLVDAARRGVLVQILVPGGEIDTEIVRRASRALWGDLLAAGIRIAEYQPTMFHCKVLVVDGMLVSVGSTNFDNRSFALNDEANLNVLDEALAQRQIEAFEDDMKHAVPISLQAWQQRPWLEKLAEHTLALLGSQL